MKNDEINTTQLYLCDPDKNDKCSKTSCRRNGGECFLTSCEEFKVWGTKAVEWELNLYTPVIFEHDGKEKRGVISAHTIDEKLEKTAYDIYVSGEKKLYFGVEIDKIRPV